MEGTTRLLLATLLLVASVYAEKDSEKALVGTTARLTCSIDRTACGEMHSVKWYRADERIYVFSEQRPGHNTSVDRKEGSMSDRLKVEYAPDAATASLIIQNVQADDEGTFRCEITYLQVGEDCDPVQLIEFHTHILPEAVAMHDASGAVLNNDSSLVGLVEGASTAVACSVLGGKPVPALVWLLNGKEISGTVTKDNNNVTSRVSLDLTRDKLGARLECRVVSDALDTDIVSSVEIDMNVPPSNISIGGVIHHVTEGTIVTLECSVLGAKPPANVTWYNGTDVVAGYTKSVKKDMTYETLSKLVFSATKFDNQRKFTCKAENEVTRQRMQSPLVESKELEVLFPPIPNVSPANITVQETARVLLFCRFEANPATLSNVTWFKNGVRVDPNTPPGHYLGGTKDKPNLLIHNVTGDDTGSYRCYMENSIGNNTSETSAEVDVQFVPQVRLNMSTGSRAVNESSHDNVTLQCDVVRGNPALLSEVTWYLDGEVLKRLPECDGLNRSRTAEEDEGFQELCYDVDPSMLLLQNTTRSFHGNYSCEGKNDAGWGPRSEEQPLVVYYPPGPAKLTYSPHQVIKGKPVKLKCSVEEKGRPEANRFQWSRGPRPVKDVDSDEWSKKVVGLDMHDNISCRAVNAAGEGEPDVVFIKVLVAPKFKYPMSPYTGALYKSQNISLSCTVEANPLVGIQWLRNQVVIDENDDHYEILPSYLPADPQKDDFQATLSVLRWNMSSWPDNKLDPHLDNAAYTCRSASNIAGDGVSFHTKFAVEFEPVNITVTPLEVSVKEGERPDKVTCSAEGNPSPKFSWLRESAGANQDNRSEVGSGEVLMLGEVQRADSGNILCKAYNKHGAVYTAAKLNVLYKPECGIQQVTKDGYQVLVCTPNANPNNVTFTWSLKSENDSLADSYIWHEDQQSFLRLSQDVEQYRTYQCVATNAVGNSTACEIDVTGNKIWYKDQQIILIGSIALAILLITIILCIIIICICRRMRAKSKCPPSNGTGNAANGQLGAENPGLYENLPFHGMQQAPNKPFKPEENDQFIYADADLKDYGPINYKQASIYAQMKKIKQQQKLQEMYDKDHSDEELL